MAQHRHINQAGADLIKSFEGRRLKAYLCSGGKWSIGYGSTFDVHQGMSITELEADARFVIDTARFERAVQKAVKVPLNDNQYAALVSFAYNVGAHNFERSTLLRLLNTGDYEAVGPQLARWVNAGGQQLRGLVRRRKAEADLFYQPAKGK